MGWENSISRGSRAVSEADRRLSERGTRFRLAPRPHAPTLSDARSSGPRRIAVKYRRGRFEFYAIK